ncbi:MAG: purine-nucleoside phosphorylase [Planctomycetia bacterium]|nr:purine-nucleoside phosphorylase [Planctomycetia bacterium]
MSPFAEFAETVAALAPRTAIVLGSGLAGATAAFVERAMVSFGDIPGLVPPTVHGHGGRLAVGEWSGVPALLFLGRLHFYEGHPWNVVTGTIRTAKKLGAKRLVLTNAAGGINPALAPGGLMAIRGHIKLLEPHAWRPLASDNGLSQPYSPSLISAMQSHERANGRELLAGIYAALTGPSYETPAEIRALAKCNADAVGMSTAMEAEEAFRLGLEVAGISCITNQAAGLGDTTLDHAEVLVNAKLAIERMGGLLGRLVRESVPRAERKSEPRP